MEHQNRKALLKSLEQVFEKPELIEEHWEVISTHLKELIETAPEGLEGVAQIINNHLSKVPHFQSSKIQKFELESGMLKLKTYFQRLNAFEVTPE